MSHEVRVAHHVGLDLLLHLHEVGRAHAEARKAREATEVSEAERSLARINWKNKKACNEIQNVWAIKSLK